MSDFIPVVKYEPKQEWGLVQEYRQRAFTRRLERDGARLKKYTKQRKPVPVGRTVAVQNQWRNFPKNLGKTGVVMENLDHDKVLVTLYGGKRLTTIVTPPYMLMDDLSHETQPRSMELSPGPFAKLFWKE